MDRYGATWTHVGGKLAQRLTGTALAVSTLALILPSMASAASQVSYPDFSDVSALQLNGNAYQNGNTVVLTDPVAIEAGSMYTRSPVDVSGSWSVVYHLQFTSPGQADGAGFVIQPNSSTALSPSSQYGGSYHGYGSVGPYVALDIDAFRNAAGILVGSELPGEGVQAPLPAHSQTPDWYVWADYDASTGTLSMYVSSTPTKPSAPLLTRTGVDLASILGTTTAYAGFAGATGGFTMGIDVDSWFFGPPPQPPAAESPVTVTASAVSATEGGAFTGTVATVGGDSDSSPADYSAQIDWGDGTTSAGTVNPDGSVTGTHTYSEEASYPVTTTVTDGDASSNTASGSATATVTDAPLSASGTDASTRPAFSGTIASFTDPNPAASAADFTATIDWGDGASSSGDVAQNAAGGWDVVASHTYSQTGPYAVKVDISDDGGAHATATSQVLVYDLPAAGGGSFVIGDGNATVGSQVDFWGSRWSAENSTSSGPAPVAFKGFADRASTDPAACGDTFTATPGNSSRPPAALPAYMGVFVASAITKQGPTISGDIAHIVVVKTSSGYQPDPGNDGTGEVLATVC